MKRAIISWSSGKDSAFALYLAQKKLGYEISGLITSLTHGTGRIGIHELRESLLDQQAAALGLPLRKIRLPSRCPNEVYESLFQKELTYFSSQGINELIFGDLFLEDIRGFREKMLMPTEIKPVFPLWGRETLPLAKEIINTGFKAVILTVDTRKLRKDCLGKDFNETFLKTLPEGVDPCGENGEFHTFTYDGPNFKYPVPFGLGDVYQHSGFLASIDLMTLQ